MSFDVSAEAYERFMGRFAEPLTDRFVDFAGLAPGSRALDVGCGPGTVTRLLVDRLGTASVVAVDPSQPFVTAVAERFPGVEVHRAVAERLPFGDRVFDLTLAQLVVHFMAHPVAGLREMGRVTRPDGVVAACVWDHGGGAGPLATFWRAVREADPAAPDQSGLPGAREGHLVELLVASGLRDVRGARLEVAVRFESFDDWWEPYTLGVGPAGAYLSGLAASDRESLRQRCARLLPHGSFEVRATAWAAAGVA